MSCLVVLLGGLARSQLVAIRAAVEAIPGVTVYEPEGDNQYQANIEPRLDMSKYDFQGVRSNVYDGLALITHSLACEAASDFKNVYGFRRVYVAEICPVWNHKANPDAEIVDVFQPTFFIDFPHATVEGAENTVIEGTGHNDICRSPIVIGKIVSRVTELAKG